MADYNLGTARGRIVVDSSGAVAGAAAADKAIAKSTGSQAAKWDKVAKGAAIGGAAIAGGLALAVNSAANFEKGISAIGAVSGASAAEMDKIREKALQIGADTSFSAGEAATAMEELVKAGISVEDTLNGAADATVALAAAGEVDLATAAEISSAAMNQFGLEAKDMTSIADLFAGAANVSAIGVEDIGESMKYVGPVAKTMGISIEDATDAIALLGSQGIKGSQAGTSLRSIFTRLEPTTKRAKDAMKELGIITEEGANRFFDAEGKAKPMAKIIDVLNGSMKNLSAQEKTTFVKNMFGVEAMSAVNILAGETGDSFNKLAGDVAKVKAADVAAARLDNLKGDIEALMGSLETLAIQIGSILLPALRKFTEALTAVVGWFTELSPGMQKAIVIAAMMTSGALLLFAAFIKVVRVIQGVRATLAAMRGAQVAATVATDAHTAATKRATIAQKLFNRAFLTNPIFLVIAAIVALVAGLVVLYKKNETFRKIVQKVWRGIQAAIGAVVGWFTDTVIPAFETAFDFIVDAAKAVLGWLKRNWQTLIVLIAGPIGAAVVLIVKHWNQIKASAVAVFNSLKPYFSTLFNVLKTIFTVGLTAIKVVFETTLNVIKAIVTTVFGALQPIVEPALKAISTLINTYVKTWITIVRVGLTVIRTIFKVTFGILRTVTRVGMGAIRNIFKTVFGAIRTVVKTVFGAIATVFRTYFQIWKELFQGRTDTLRNIISNGFQKARELVVNAFRTMRDRAVQIFTGLKDKISGIKDMVLGIFSDAKNWLFDAGKNVIQGFIDGIGSMFGAAKDKLGDFTSSLTSWKGPPSRDRVILKPAGEMVMQGFQDGLESRMASVQWTLENFTNRVAQQANNAKNLVKNDKANKRRERAKTNKRREDKRGTSYDAIAKRAAELQVILEKSMGPAMAKAAAYSQAWAEAVKADLEAKRAAAARRKAEEAAATKRKKAEKSKAGGGGGKKKKAKGRKATGSDDRMIQVLRNLTQQMSKTLNAVQQAARVSGPTYVTNNNQKSQSIVFNNYGLKEETPSDANARQMRALAASGILT